MSKKLVVITGASSGFGAELAKLFNANGHALLLLARRRDKLEELGLSDCLCRKVDVRDKEQVLFAIKEAEEVFGPVDCVINNAGLMQLGNTATQDTQEWRDMFDVNVLGLLNGIHAVAHEMKTRGTGTIINISSVAGRKNFPNHTVYCGTKFAVHAISENLRQELASSNVRVITIAPGAVPTELLGHTTDEKVINDYDKWRTDAEIKITTQDIAQSILFAYQMPQNVCIRELVIADTRQEM